MTSIQAIFAEEEKAFHLAISTGSQKAIKTAKSVLRMMDYTQAEISALTVKHIEIEPTASLLRIQKIADDELNDMIHLGFDNAKSRLLESYNLCQNCMEKDSLAYQQYDHAVKYLESKKQ